MPQTTLKLRAVNKILRAISASPVTSVTNPENPQGLVALGELDDAKREVLLEAMWHGVTRKTTLTPNAAGTIELNSELILNVRPTTTTVNFSVRGGLLYNNTANSDTFTSNIEVYITEDVDFDDLSASLQNYITNKARASLFRDKIGEGALMQKYDNEMYMARSKARRENRIGKNGNMIYDNPTGSAIARSRSNNAVDVRAYNNLYVD